MKTNEQLLNEITALMATAWLAACERRVIGTTPEGKHVAPDYLRRVCLFGPASADEGRGVDPDRSAALNVFRAPGPQRVADAAMTAVANGHLPARRPFQSCGRFLLSRSSRLGVSALD